MSEDGSVHATIWLAPSLHYVPVKMRVTGSYRGMLEATLEATLDSIRVDETLARAMTPRAACGRTRSRDWRRRSPRSGRSRSRPTRCCTSSSGGTRRWASTTGRSSPTASSRTSAGGARWRPLAQTQSPRHLALAVLVRELGIGVRECEGALSADDALWLRAFKSRLATPLPPAVAADLPDWLWERLGAAYGDAERAALAHAWLSAAPLDLRVNPLKTTRDEARAALAASGIAAEPTPYSPLGLRVARPSGAGAAPAVHGGRDRSAGRRQPARRLPRRAEAHRTWSSISARAPAARRCSSAR